MKKGALILTVLFVICIAVQTLMINNKVSYGLDVPIKDISILEYDIPILEDDSDLLWGDGLAPPIVNPLEPPVWIIELREPATEEEVARLKGIWENIPSVCRSWEALGSLNLNGFHRFEKGMYFPRGILQQLGLSTLEAFLVPFGMGIDIFDPSEPTLHLTGGDIEMEGSVIIAKEIVFDNATLWIDESVKEFIIIADRIVSTNSELQWDLHNTKARDGVEFTKNAPPGTPSYSPTNESSGTAFYAKEGGNGEDGADPGTAQHGDDGRDAPHVTIFVRELVTDADGYPKLPAILVSGQSGGDGAQGQRGGQGGNGAKGLESGVFKDIFGHELYCFRGPGYGGDGGDGGNGGKGGDGGDAGAGGGIRILYVQAPPNLTTTGYERNDTDTSNGQPGDDGDGGDGGKGGVGGKQGDPHDAVIGDCGEQPGRDGKPGKNGSKGSPGSEGRESSTQNKTRFGPITEQEWNEARSLPYLVAAEGSVILGTGFDGEPVVTVYQHCNYGGYEVRLPVGSYTLDQLLELGVRNNDLSSLKVPSGLRAILFQGDKFQGQQWVYESDEQCFVNTGNNDVVSSIRIEPAGTATVYQHCSYHSHGYAIDLPVGCYTLKDLQNLGIRNNDISSIRLPPGFRAVLYDGDNFDGEYWVHTSDDPCFVRSSNGNHNDLASSLKIEYLGEIPGKAQVGMEVRFYTYNDDGFTPVEIEIQSEIQSDPNFSEPVLRISQNLFSWIVPLHMTAGRYIIFLRRTTDLIETNPIYLEILPYVDRVLFGQTQDNTVEHDEMQAFSGRSAHLLGYGFHDAMHVLFGKSRVQEVELDDCCDQNSRQCECEGMPHMQRLSFTIPMQTVDAKGIYVGHDGLAPIPVIIDQVTEGLSRFKGAEVYLKKHYGLTFLPFNPQAQHVPLSMHDPNMLVRNGEMTEAVRMAVDRDLVGTFWSNYNAYPDMPVPPSWGLNMLLWYSFWVVNQASANCTGMSSLALENFFYGNIPSKLDIFTDNNGIVQVGTSSGFERNRSLDYAAYIVRRSGRIISNPFLSMLTAQAMSPASEVTEATVLYTVDFFCSADTNYRKAPIFEMFTAGLDTILKTIPHCNPLNSNFDITNIGSFLYSECSPGLPLNEAFESILDNISHSHALAPYMVVFDHNSAYYPERIYFYDSNINQGEQSNSPFMTITETSEGLEFEYEPNYSTEKNYVLGLATIETIVDIPAFFLLP